MKRNSFSEIVKAVESGDIADKPSLAQELIEMVQERNGRIARLESRQTALLTALEHVTDAVKALQWEGE